MALVARRLGPRYEVGMWDAFIGWGGWDEVGTGAAWFVTACLIISGLVGCVIPVLPGHLLILIAAIGHRLMMDGIGRDSGVEWWTFVVLVLLLVASQAFEFFSGAAGAKWFGGTRWGSAGALIGGIVGIFFIPFGLVLGPLIGAIVCELAFAKKEVKPATVSGVGSVAGVAAGLVVKLAVGVTMTLWFFVDVWFIG